MPREVARTCTTGDSRICWPVDYCCRETCLKPCPTRGLRSASSKQTSDFYHRDRTRYTECHREAQRQPPFGRAGTIILRHGSPAGNRQQRRARGTILSFSVALCVPRSVSVLKIACFKPRDHPALSKVPAPFGHIPNRRPGLTHFFAFFVTNSEKSAEIAAKFRRAIRSAIISIIFIDIRLNRVDPPTVSENVPNQPMRRKYSAARVFFGPQDIDKAGYSWRVLNMA